MRTFVAASGICRVIIVAAIALFVFPNVTLGQTAPALGTASSFALFTGTGASFVNSKATLVTGDIGSNASTITGFSPGQVVGATEVMNGVSAQVATDVGQAYSALAALIDTDVLTNSTLGNGQILSVPFGSASKVYHLDEAGTINGDLILDANNDPNAVFIIKILGALSTNASSRVILQNGASLCNVYWRIQGAVSLGASSVFRGTIVSVGAISLLEGSSLYGRALSTAGAIDLHNNTVSITVSIAAFSPAESTRCQGAGTVTTTTTAVNNSIPVVYSLDATTAAFSGNSIDAATGAVTYDAAWYGTTIITATATGCTGSVSATHTVTVYPVPNQTLIYHY